MSARRDNRRPPSGKVFRSEPGIANLSKSAPARPSTAAVNRRDNVPRPTTNANYADDDNMNFISRDRPQSGRTDLSFAKTAPNRPSTAGIGRRDTTPRPKTSANFGGDQDFGYSLGERSPQSGRYDSRENNKSQLFSKQRPTSSGGNRNDRSFGFTAADKNANFNNNQTAEMDFTKTEQHQSARSEASELSTNELLRRMREKSDIAKNKVDFATIEKLGGFNYFSRPKTSTVHPLRTVLLDPQVNNCPPSKTRTELMRKIKASGIPHLSYDLDMDGYVSQQDYRPAKRFDFDGNGVLDPNERHIGKQILADEFFKRHTNDLYNFGGNLANNDHKKNVQKLVNSHSFEHTYDKLLQIERKLVAEGSKPIRQCLRSNVSEDVLKHNYYTDKFDTTAWNDFEGIPRAASSGGLAYHGGSRKKLLFGRSELHRTELQTRMETQPCKTFLPVMYAKRVNMITDVKFEND